MLKRAGTGLRSLDHDRACPGFTLFAPMSGAGNIYLIDLDGELIHSWQMPYTPGNYGYLTERGTLFYRWKDRGRFKALHQPATRRASAMRATRADAAAQRQSAHL